MYNKFQEKEIEENTKCCDEFVSILDETDAIANEQTHAPNVIKDFHREQKLEVEAKKSLIFGILSLALGSVIGFILALIGLKHAKKHNNLNEGHADGRAIAGMVISIIGIPYGIVSFLFQVAVIAGFLSYFI